MKSGVCGLAFFTEYIYLSEGNCKEQMMMMKTTAERSGKMRIHYSICVSRPCQAQVHEYSTPLLCLFVERELAIWLFMTVKTFNFFFVFSYSWPRPPRCGINQKFRFIIRNFSLFFFLFGIQSNYPFFLLSFPDGYSLAEASEIRAAVVLAPRRLAGRRPAEAMRGRPVDVDGSRRSFGARAAFRRIGGRGLVEWRWRHRHRFAIVAGSDSVGSRSIRLSSDRSRSDGRRGFLPFLERCRPGSARAGPIPNGYLFADEQSIYGRWPRLQPNAVAAQVASTAARPAHAHRAGQPAQSAESTPAAAAAAGQP